jgi:acyl-CoA thioester hydrolase
MPRPNPEILNPANYPFKIIIPTRFVDINIGNHVSNIAIIQMFEDARARFYAAREIAIVSGDEMLMIVSNTIDYIKEVHWPHDLDIYCKFEKIGGASFQLRQLAVQNSKPVATCLVTSVNTKNNKTAPINEDLRAKLG